MARTDPASQELERELDPIGRRLKNAADPRSTNPWRTVVGIVADVKYAGLAERADPAFYVPLQQAPSRDEYLVVRTSGDPAGVVGGIRQALHSIDPNLPLGDIRTLDERLWQSTGPVRFRTGLMALFGVMGLVLAAIGIYGVSRIRSHSGRANSASGCRSAPRRAICCAWS